MKREKIQSFLRAIYLKQGLLKIKRATRKSHSGWEIRLAASSPEEAQSIERALKSLRLRSGRPFRKNRRIIVPLYGESQVHLFFEEIHPEQLALFPTSATPPEENTPTPR